MMGIATGHYEALEMWPRHASEEMNCFVLFHSYNLNLRATLVSIICRS